MSQVEPPAKHAVHSEELNLIMRGLEAKVSKVWPQEIADVKAAQNSRERKAAFRRAAILARAMGDAAGMIPEAISDTQLSSEDHKSFLAGVDGLKREVKGVEAAAQAQDVQKMKGALGQVRTKCTACHDKFAELAGPIHYVW